MASDKRAEVFLDVEPEARTAWQDVEPTPELPFRVLILGDLCGARADRKPLAARVPIRIDRDDFDDVLARLRPEIELRLDGDATARVVIRDLDDFHPDALYRSLPVFSALREMRERLEDPRSFGAAARELMGEAAEPGAPARPPAGSILDSILGEVDGGTGPAGGEASPSGAGDSLQRFIRTILSPHRVPGEDPRQAALLERADRAVTPMMRAVLHDPGFRSIEALWRCIHLLTRRVETDASLGIWLFDVTRAELAKDLGAAAGPAGTSALYRAVVDREVGTPGGSPWSLIVGDFAFGPTAPDVQLLAGLAALGRATNAPFIGAATPALAGAPDFAREADPAEWQAVGSAEWSAFRRSPAARFAGLALPRFLVRQPWGEEGEPCDAFDFEEVDAPPRHEDLLWGNPAFACAVLLARAFSRAGWQLRSGFDPDLSGLPLHLFREAGETKSQPCAETLLTERAADRLLDAGLMPLASIRDRDAVRLVRLQSVTDPAAPLAARW